MFFNEVDIRATNQPGQVWSDLIHGRQFSIKKKKRGEGDMKTYESYWRINENRLIAYRLYLAGSREPAELVQTTYGHKKGIGLLKRFGVSNCAYPRHQHFTFSAQEGSSAAVEKYLDMTEEIKTMAEPVFQRDLVSMRPKTSAELLLDEAALWLATGDTGLASDMITTLTACHERDNPQCMYFQTIAMGVMDACMRAETNRQRIREYRDAAERWAVTITENYRRLTARETYPQQHIGYYFDTAYKNAASQVVAAAVIRAGNALEFDLNPALALQLVGFALSTGHRSGELYTLYVRTLLALGREHEAFEVYQSHQAMIGSLPELNRDEAYIAYLNTIRQSREAAAAQRRNMIKVSNGKAMEWSADQIDRLEARFPGLPAPYRAWLAAGSGTMLVSNTLTGNEARYERFTLDQALDAHVEFLERLHMYDDMWPEGAAKIHAHIKATGINPQRMIPLMGGQDSLDCFLLRLDGKRGEAGSVYYWNHEQCAVFTQVASCVEKLEAGVGNWAYNLVA